jgi:hypothetical protein
MNQKSIIIFLVSLALAFIAGVALFNLSLPLLNSLFPPVTTDSFNRKVHIMPVGNMLWSLAISIGASILVLTFVLKKLLKQNSR